MSMSFDFEQEIFRCWNVVEELKLYADKEVAMSAEEKDKYLQGVIMIYETRFGALFDMYEQLIAESRNTEREKTLG